MSKKIVIFLVAGSQLLREALGHVLGKYADLSVAGAAPFHHDALEQIATSGCEVLLLDSLSASLTDLQLIRDVVNQMSQVKVLLVGMDENEETFINSIRAGVVGYVLRDASMKDVVAAVRAVAHGEAVCPPRLCLSLFNFVSREYVEVPCARITVRLGLTRRQQQLVPLIAKGLSNKEIASHLNLSEQTIKNHIHRMLHKMGATDRLSVVEKVRMEGISL